MAGLVAAVENDRQQAVTRFPGALRLRELGSAQNLVGRDRGVVCALRTSMLCPLAPCGVDMNAPPITSPDAALRVWSPFFFSSRRRHTSYIGDWSSDVCSSD